jgi:hypothetical protein
LPFMASVLGMARGWSAFGLVLIALLMKYSVAVDSAKARAIGLIWRQRAP